MIGSGRRTMLVLGLLAMVVAGVALVIVTRNGSAPARGGFAFVRSLESDRGRCGRSAYGRGSRATVIYTTAYTFNAAQGALERCIAQHGEWVCARVVTDHPSQGSAL